MKRKKENKEKKQNTIRKNYRTKYTETNVD